MKYFFSFVGMVQTARSLKKEKKRSQFKNAKLSSRGFFAGLHAWEICNVQDRKKRREKTPRINELAFLAAGLDVESDWLQTG